MPMHNLLVMDNRYKYNLALLKWYSKYVMHTWMDNSCKLRSQNYHLVATDHNHSHCNNNQVHLDSYHLYKGTLLNRYQPNNYRHLVDMNK